MSKKFRPMNTLSDADDQCRIIAHAYREERRAVHHPGKKVLRYEYLDSSGNWIIDYTTWDSTIQTEYFPQFYGPQQEKK